MYVWLRSSVCHEVQYYHWLVDISRTPVIFGPLPKEYSAEFHAQDGFGFERRACMVHNNPGVGE